MIAPKLLGNHFVLLLNVFDLFFFNDEEIIYLGVLFVIDFAESLSCQSFSYILGTLVEILVYGWELLIGVS